MEIAIDRRPADANGPRNVGDIGILRVQGKHCLVPGEHRRMASLAVLLSAQLPRLFQAGGAPPEDGQRIRLREDCALVLEEAIQRVPEILDEMKPIGDLYGSRSTAGRAVGVEIAAVATDQGDTGMGGEPGRDAVGRAIR